MRPITMDAPYNVKHLWSVSDIINFLELERELRDKPKERHCGYRTLDLPMIHTENAMYQGQ